MKIINVKFKNFRLLKDLELDFSVDPIKKLTVIRAANETGKTTTLNGLIWGLYGSEYLPSKHYIISPHDLIQDGKNIKIEVDISFTTDVSLSSKSKETLPTTYILRRECMEEVINGSPSRRAEKLALFENARDGVKIIDEDTAKRIINDALPVSLKDIYFTDGDSALSFIDANTNSAVKRRRVEDAIKSLLGLDYIEKSQKIIDKVLRQFENEVDEKDYAKLVSVLNDRKESLEEDIQEFTTVLNENSAALETEKHALKDIEQKIELILTNGNKDDLNQQKNECTRQIERSKIDNSNHLLALAKHTYDYECSCRLIAERAKSVQAHLINAKHEKQIPKLDIPVLTQLLKKDTCFCGTALDENKRKSISEVISNSIESDAVTDVATTLLHQVSDIDFDAIKNNWLESYNTLMTAQANNESALIRANRTLDEIDAKIASIDDTSLQIERQKKIESSRKIERYYADIGSANHGLIDAKDRLKQVLKDKLANEEKLNKGNKSTSYIFLTKEIKSTYEKIYDKLKKDELEKVSDEMNRIFLSMIGASPDINDRTTITKAVLNTKYDIEVYGARGRKLNPDQDLNGASRRAITLAFILALTKVSEVQAPNFIDTPLGMMTGYVKQSAMNETLKEGSQVILFLTHDEIKGVEEIIEKYAGRILTLTNPAHYPLMLKNKPETTDIRILRCDCNHKSQCALCERKLISLG